MHSSCLILQTKLHSIYYFCCYTLCQAAPNSHFVLPNATKEQKLLALNNITSITDLNFLQWLFRQSELWFKDSLKYLKFYKKTRERKVSFSHLKVYCGINQVHFNDSKYSLSHFLALHTPIFLTLQQIRWKQMINGDGT